MGKMNLLKANWVGRVGQTVGAKWKDKSTIRSYTKPAYTDTPAQQTIRTGFGLMAAFVALFAPLIKSVNPINVKAMSLRNAILSLNKAQIIDGTFDASTLSISRGGLPLPSGVSTTGAVAGATITATWTPAVGATITTKARFVVVAVQQSSGLAWSGSALNTAGTLVVPAVGLVAGSIDVYTYLLDYRGSSKVGSVSAYAAVTAA